MTKFSLSHTAGLEKEKKGKRKKKPGRPKPHVHGVRPCCWIESQALLKFLSLLYTPLPAPQLSIPFLWPALSSIIKESVRGRWLEEQRQHVILGIQNLALSPSWQFREPVLFKNKQGTEREDTLRHNTWKPCKGGLDLSPVSGSQGRDKEFIFKSKLSHMKVEQGLGSRWRQEKYLGNWQQNWL